MDKMRGLTLIELLVTMAILAILMGLAAPSFLRTVRSNAMATGVNTFLADMRYARSEAVRRGGRVVLCRTDLPEAATPSCAADAGTTGKGWATGWIIFHDLDGNGDYSTGDATLRVQAGLGSVDRVLEGTATASTKFRFTATGRLSDTGSAAKLVFGGDNFATDLKRVICVSAGGRGRIAGDGNAGCGTANE